MNRRWIIPIVVVALVVVGGWLIWRQYIQTYHLRTVHEGALYRDGLRNMREFNTACLKVRPQTVISLLGEDERTRPPYNQEFDYCRHSRIRWVQLNVKRGGWPTTVQVRDFLRFAEDPKLQPVLVHCGEGIRRTGMMVAAYQMSVMNYTREQAKEAIESFGHSERTINDIKRFIDAYDPQARSVPEELSGQAAAEPLTVGSD